LIYLNVLRLFQIVLFRQLKKVHRLIQALIIARAYFYN
jgi:hypothetical protein